MIAVSDYGCRAQVKGDNSRHRPGYGPQTGFGIECFFEGGALTERHISETIS